MSWWNDWMNPLLHPSIHPSLHHSSCRRRSWYTETGVINQHLIAVCCQWAECLHCLSLCGKIAIPSFFLCHVAPPFLSLFLLLYVKFSTRRETWASIMFYCRSAAPLNATRRHTEIRGCRLIRRECLQTSSSSSLDCVHRLGQNV